MNGAAFETGLTGTAVTHTNFNQTFTQTFAGAPLFFASVQTFAGSDPVNIRSNSVSASAANFFLDEEASIDSETNHAAENVGFLAIDMSAFSSPVFNRQNSSNVADENSFSNILRVPDSILATYDSQLSTGRNLDQFETGIDQLDIADEIGELFADWDSQFQQDQPVEHAIDFELQNNDSANSPVDDAFAADPFSQLLSEIG